MNRYFERIWRLLSERKANSAITDEIESQPRILPIVWLLGKTGAGKSSLIRSLTGISEAQLGNGFEPCTRTAVLFDFPVTRPLVRFLDTRGLGEAGYDPLEDLSQCERRSHVTLVVARLDDPVQTDVVKALSAVRRRQPDTPIVVVHTGADLLSTEEERFRARSANQSQFEKAAGSSLPYAEVGMPPGTPDSEYSGLDTLVAHLDEIIPEVALLLARYDKRDDERARFARVRGEVLWYASAAGTSDIAPVVGAVTVPSIQAAMLRMLGNRYGCRWTRQRMGEFGVALGVGVAGRYGASYLLRQVTKLIPVFGQTAGAAAAGTISFATTFAMGRAAAYYLYKLDSGEAVDSDELRSIYKDALKRARHERR